LGFGTTSDPLVLAALWSGVGALIATGVLVLAIIAARIALILRQRVERRAAARWNPLIAQCAEQTPQSIPALRRRDVETFLVLWCRAQESLRGAAQDNLRALAYRLELGSRVQQLQRSGTARLELLALVALGHLRERAAIPLLLRLVPQAAPVMSLAAAQALMRIDAAVGLPCVLKAVAARDDWSLAPVVSMLLEADPQEVGAQLSALIGAELEHERRAHGGAGLARLLRLHVAAPNEALRGVVQAALARETLPEPLCAALAALTHPADADYARALLDHPAVPVRVAAARVLGRVGGAADHERLCHALSDRDWWVRYRAAQALCALPQADREALRALAERMADRFAGDMLRQALAEREAA
jgi:HEAT repeat protein